MDDFILKHCYFNIIFFIWKASLYTLWTDSWEKPCLDILFSAVGGMKISFIRMLYTFFVEISTSIFSLSENCKGEFFIESFQEVGMVLTRPK